jgi:hypothetical protein
MSHVPIVDKTVGMIRSRILTIYLWHSVAIVLARRPVRIIPWPRAPRHPNRPECADGHDRSTTIEQPAPTERIRATGLQVRA